jgi:hypothetical protein
LKGLTANPNPVRLTGNSLNVHSHKEKHFFISGNPFLLAGILFSLQGFPSKPLYFPVGDCSALNEWTAKGVATDPYEFSVVASTHWTYLLQILSKLCFQRVAFSENYEIVAISTDKTTIFNDLDYKADIGQHFHKSEKSTRWRHCHKIIKTNLKTLVSPLLIRPQGSQGC